MLKFTRKYLLMSLGFAFVALGVIGAFLPVMPTTPFLILAAFLFSKSSKKWHDWVLSRPYVGPLIKDWEESGVIARKGKIWSTVFIVPLFLYTFFFVQVHLGVRVFVQLLGVSVLYFIWSRPSERQWPTSSAPPEENELDDSRSLRS